MRYIRQQIFITTISDQEVTDRSEIYNLFHSLKSSSADFDFSYRDPRIDSIISHKNCRVKNVSKDSIGITSINKRCSVNIKEILFSNVISVKLVADTDNIIIQDKKKFSKFELLQIEEEE